MSCARSSAAFGAITMLALFCASPALADVTIAPDSCPLDANCDVVFSGVDGGGESGAGCLVVDDNAAGIFTTYDGGTIADYEGTATIYPLAEAEPGPYLIHWAAWTLGAGSACYGDITNEGDINLTLTSTPAPVGTPNYSASSSAAILSTGELMLAQFLANLPIILAVVFAIILTVWGMRWIMRFLPKR